MAAVALIETGGDARKIFHDSGESPRSARPMALALGGSSPRYDTRGGLYMSNNSDNTTTEAQDSDRDTRMMRYAGAKGHLREATKPAQFVHNRTSGLGGAQIRMTDVSVGPNDSREHFSASRASRRYVPVGFARYEPPTINPLEYAYVRIAGWRVVIPRGLPGPVARALLRRIFRYGPLSAGYTRIGDSLVPRILEYQDRMTLNNVATGFDGYDKDTIGPPDYFDAE